MKRKLADKKDYVKVSQISMIKRMYMKINTVTYRNYFALALMIPLMVFSGCLNKDEKKEKSVLVVNVLGQEFYDDCHIPGSVQIDFAKIMEVSKSWSKSAKIVVYCANYSCSASASAVRSLKNEGFNAYEYAAGMAGWFQAGYPIEGEAQSPYLTLANEPHGETASDLPVISTEELAQLLNVQPVEKR